LAISASVILIMIFLYDKKDHPPLGSVTASSEQKPEAVHKEALIERGANGSSKEREIKKSQSIEHPPRLPASLPASQILALLKPYAQKGSNEAACRIAMELQHCAQSAMNINVASILAQSAAISHNKQDIENQVALAARLSNNKDPGKCQGITDDDLKSAFAYQVLASRSIPAMRRRIAINPALDKGNFLNQLEEWKKYKVIADSYFNDALKSHKVEDLIPLLQVYQPIGSISPSVPLRRNDPATFLALYRIAVGKNIRIPEFIHMAANADNFDGNVKAKSESILDTLTRQAWIESSQDTRTESPYPADITLCEI